MAYTAWSVVYGEQPTAAKWNQLGTNDAGFKDGTNIDAGAITQSKIADGAINNAKLDPTAGEVGGAWLPYTPSWTASTSNPSIGNGTLTGRYTKRGKTIVAQIMLVFGSTTTVGNGVYRWSLPVAPKSGQRYVGSGFALRSGSAFYPFPVSNIDIFAAIQAYVQLINTGGGVSHSTASWGNGDIFCLEITYEID